MKAPLAYQSLPVSQLQLDVTNPRIRRWVEIYGENPTAEQIYLALGAGGGDSSASGPATFRSLKEAIRTQRGVIHPVIVNKTSDGSLVVIEGNTRVAIYRSFQTEEGTENWNLIPAIVYENLTQEEIDAIRLQAHLVGPRDWDAYSKAKYLYTLRNLHHLPFNQIVDYCGGRQKEVQNYIDAYIDMERYYREVVPDDSAFDVTRFSAFVELQKSGIKEAIVKASFTYKDFAEWVHERLIDPQNTVRQLPRILANEKSRKTFFKHGAREALKVLDVPAPDASLQDAPWEQIAAALLDKLAHIEHQEVKQLREIPSNTKSQILLDLRDAVTGLCEEIVEGN